MTNPAAAIRSLIIYAIIIPTAALVGYMLCNPLDYGTLGFFGLIALLVASPVIIRWHYPILVFGLSSPIYCFFLKGNPPLAQVAILLSLGIAIVNRTINSDKRFMSVPTMTWPLLFTVAMAYFTAEMTGGIGLKALGGDVAGGKKYLALFIGVAGFFALTSRVIPKEDRKLYLMLYFLPGVLQVFSDLFTVLPSPLNSINLLIPPSSGAGQGGETTRLGAVGSSGGVIANYMLARYGLRNIFDLNRPLRMLAFFVFLGLTMLGGFRIVLINYVLILSILFFMEGLHRTRIMPLAILGGLLCMTLLIPFASHLPYSFQRSLSFVPMLKLDSMAVADADGSKRWREEMWRDTWPKVPDYLLLGKGYALSMADFQLMGDGQFANGINMQMDKSMTALAISGDYHNGPLSTLMPFGIWGAISYLWVAMAGLYIIYRNYKYGDAELKPFNAFMLVLFVVGVFNFFFIFGAYSNDIGAIAKTVGFSVALNQGICKPKALPVVTPRIKPLPRPRLVTT